MVYETRTRWTARKYSLDQLGRQSAGGELVEEFALVHAVLESFLAVNEDDGNFVGELAAQVVVGIDIDVAPGESAAALQLDERFFHKFAQVTSSPRVHDHLVVPHGADFIRRKLKCGSQCRSKIVVC